MKYFKYIEIAGLRIRVWSKSTPSPDEKKTADRYAGFIKEDSLGKVDINLEVVATKKKLSAIKSRKIIFEVKRNIENHDWLLAEGKNKYILYTRLGEPCSTSLAKDYSRARMLVGVTKNASSWKMSQLIYGPLQLMLMNYLAKHRLGVLVHSSGVNYKGKGFLFVAQTRFGKSTTARFWSKRKGAVVLNDDRIVLRRTKKGLCIFGTPWHGDFSDYLDTISGSAPLKRLFFIYHLKANRLKPLNAREAFNRFFPNTFPIFWDKKDVRFTFDFLCEVIKKVPAFSLGFVNDASVVDYVLQHEKNDP
ncbi:MAG: hypothetical protein NT099_04975 [Candidatus Saganbacteria bacterium]|nr:hypothetical protein [Candidatus Saganbacteria bacterium]